MRNLSPLAKQAIYAANTAQIFCHLIEIAHPSITTKRYVNLRAGVQHQGNTYESRAFIALLPPEQKGSVPRLNLVIDNTDREPSDLIRQMAAHQLGTVTHKVVMKGQLDTIEAGPFRYKLKEATFDRQMAVLVLGYEDFLNLSFPALEFRPDTHPALHGRLT